MIRLATLADIPVIAEMGERFHEEAGWGDIATYSREDCAETLKQLVEADHGILLVAEAHGQIIGMAGGLMFPLYFNASHLTGQEMFWWVEPTYRRGAGKALLDALEDTARACGCESWIMISLDKVAPEVMGRLYRRRGYRASEHSFIKRL